METIMPKVIARDEIDIIRAYLKNDRLPIMYKLPKQNKWKVFDIPRARV